MINQHGASQRNNAACDYGKDQNRDPFGINIFQTRRKIIAQCPLGFGEAASHESKNLI